MPAACCDTLLSAVNVMVVFIMNCRWRHAVTHHSAADRPSAATWPMKLARSSCAQSAPIVHVASVVSFFAAIRLSNRHTLRAADSIQSVHCCLEALSM